MSSSKQTSPDAEPGASCKRSAPCSPRRPIGSVAQPPNFETEGAAICAGITGLLHNCDQHMDDLRLAMEAFRTAALHGVTPNAVQDLNRALRMSFRKRG